jgi:hypothetical protein
MANAMGHSDDRVGVSANDDPLGRSGEGSSGRDFNHRLDSHRPPTIVARPRVCAPKRRRCAAGKRSEYWTWIRKCSSRVDSSCPLRPFPRGGRPGWGDEFTSGWCGPMDAIRVMPR